MSLPDFPRSATRAALPPRRLLGLAAALLLAGATAGCFKPMYAESSQADGIALQDKLSDVEVVFVGGRVGNEVRNDLIFNLTGGAGNPAGAPYRLVMKVTDNTEQTYINSVSGLPEVEMVTVTADWQLFASGDDKKPLTQSKAFGKASLDSGFQRFARNRAIRDAQNRASTMVADAVRGQLAVYFSTRPAQTSETSAAPTPAAPAPKS